MLFVCAIGQLKAQYHKTTPGADTLIFFNGGSTCSMYIGFYLDDDEVDFLYDLKVDSTCGMTDYKLILADHWGNVQGEINENHLAYAVGYSHDPYHGAKEFYYFFSYKDSNGIVQTRKGFVKDVWW